MTIILRNLLLPFFTNKRVKKYTQLIEYLLLNKKLNTGKIQIIYIFTLQEGSFEMESIVACDITDKPDDEDLWTFRIVLENKPNSNSYKKVYFQALKDTVLEIHSKVSHLLHWHSRQSRSNYLVYKELKSRRRKTNLF